MPVIFSTYTCAGKKTDRNIPSWCNLKSYWTWIPWVSSVFDSVQVRSGDLGPWGSCIWNIVCHGDGHGLVMEIRFCFPVFLSSCTCWVEWSGAQFQFENISTIRIWSTILCGVAHILLDMARYGAQKGPTCLTCVPVTLCRKIFFCGGGGGGGHKLPVYYIEHLMYWFANYIEHT